MTWKEIEGYRYPYRVSDQGEVQKLQDNGKWKTLKQWSYRGQMKVHLRCRDGTVERIGTSKLVADYFMGGTPPGMMRVHKNGMKRDNAVENIVFRPIGKSGARPGNCRPVLKVDRMGKVVSVYQSGAEAARANHISQTSISKRCLGRIKDPYRLDGYNYVFDGRYYMKIENGKIVEITEVELFSLYLERGMDDVMDFHEYRRRMERAGCTVIEEAAHG